MEILAYADRQDRLKALSPGRRSLYSLLLALTIAGALFMSVALSVGVTVLAISLLETPTANDLLAIAVLNTLALMAALGFTGGALIPPGMSLRQAAIKTGKMALRQGFIAGGIFGLLFFVFSRLILLRLDLGQYVLTVDVVLLAVSVGVVTAPALALFRMVAVTAEDGLIYALT